METADVDMNLLVSLDVLLTEGSVTGAARRLGLSTSAMSRTLTRLREATGDPLLVRAGRGLVPTPRAEELRVRVHGLARDVRAVLRPRIKQVDVASLELTFTIRVSEAFLEFLSGPVVAAVSGAAPRVCLRFVSKPDKDARPLREGLIDLEIGVLGTSAPEIRTQLLFHDRLVGVARLGHPLLESTVVTPEAYTACGHVAASKDGESIQLIDIALERLGLRRAIKVVVPGYPDANADSAPIGSGRARAVFVHGQRPWRSITPRLRALRPSNHRSRCRASAYPRCGILEWTPTRPIAGCATQ